MKIDVHAVYNVWVHEFVCSVIHSFLGFCFLFVSCILFYFSFLSILPWKTVALLHWTLKWGLGFEAQKKKSSKKATFQIITEELLFFSSFSNDSENRNTAWAMTVSINFFCFISFLIHDKTFVKWTWSAYCFIIDFKLKYNFFPLFYIETIFTIECGT